MMISAAAIDALLETMRSGPEISYFSVSPAGAIKLVGTMKLLEGGSYGEAFTHLVGTNPQAFFPALSGDQITLQDVEWLKSKLREGYKYVAQGVSGEFETIWYYDCENQRFTGAGEVLEFFR